MYCKVTKINWKFGIKNNKEKLILIINIIKINIYIKFCYFIWAKF